MCRSIKAALLPLIACAVVGCVTTSEMPLARNVWQASTEAQGSLFTGKASNATMKRAAELTLAQGFDSFVVQNPQARSGSVYVGSTPTVANTNINVYGSTAYGTTTYTGGEAIMAPHRDVSVMAVIFHAGEPGAAQAVDAAAYLQRLNG